MKLITAGFIFNHSLITLMSIFNLKCHYEIALTNLAPGIVVGTNASDGAIILVLVLVWCCR